MASKYVVSVLIACAAQVLALPVLAQAPPAAFQAPPATTEIGGGFWKISGGSNAVLAVGSDGAVLVDSLFRNPDKLLESVRAITSLPVKYVVNTHEHRDHTGGNATFAKLGAVVVSTPAAAKGMSAPGLNMRNEVQPAIEKEGWATVTYGAKAVIPVAGLELVFLPVKPAHTDGDAIVFFPKANVLVMGDLHHSNEFPVYDAQVGCACGSFEGNLNAYRVALMLANDQTKIVPGHGGITNKAEMTAYVAMLVNVRNQIEGMIKQGRTKEEVIAANLLAGPQPVQAGGPNNADNFVGVLYTALKTGKGA